MDLFQCAGKVVGKNYSIYLGKSLVNDGTSDTTTDTHTRGFRL